MRFLKLMTYCAILSSLVLVSCNKDKAEVKPTQDQNISGLYTSTRYEVSECRGSANNELQIWNCETSGCMQMELKADMTFTNSWFMDGMGEESGSGTYEINDDVVTFTSVDKSTGTVNDSFDMSINGDKLMFSEKDPVNGCLTTFQYRK